MIDKDNSSGESKGKPLIPGLPLDLADIPDANAPFIRNAWYVIAESKNVGKELKSIRVLDEPLVMYRTEDGEAVVLDDRCAHRRFALSKSKLINDQIQCGYHGFTFEKSGRCVWAPTNVKPNFGVRRYPCTEVGPWLWVWMGDPDKAESEPIHYPSQDTYEGWHQIEGYKFNPANYLLLIENLLDLTHLHFLHGDGVADESQANTPMKTISGITNGVGYIKDTPSAEAKLFASLTGNDPTKKVRVVTGAKQFGPSLNCAFEERFAPEGDNDPLYPILFHIVHAITPETMGTTHQFFQCSINRTLLIGMEKFCEMLENVVFQQDCDAMEDIQATIESDRRTGIVEFGIAGDRFGMAMRKILRDMHRKEADLLLGQTT